jgi:pyridoxamine 5'-phosphate oxidase
MRVKNLEEKVESFMQDISKLPLESLSTQPPENLVGRVWQELSRASKDRHHAWRRPAFATLGVDGFPQVRTIVLRHADQTRSTLRAYTDSRSPKCQEILKCNQAQLVFWSERLRWQLRVSVRASVYHEGEVVEKAWASVSQSHALKDYLAKQAPGSAIVSDRHHEDFLVHQPVNHHLAVLNFEVICMDWLELGKDMHRRAQIDANGIVTVLTP